MKAFGWSVLAAVILAGCTGGRHLSDAYGRAYHDTWRAQRANGSAVAKAEKGLDAQEATIIANSYRQSLAPKGARTEEQPEVLLIAPDQRGGRPAALAPSVPKEK